MIILEIRENETQKVCCYVMDVDWLGDYMWREGNFSCDCNRELFFGECLNEDRRWNIACSEGRYSVNVFDEWGNTLYGEFGPEKAEYERNVLIENSPLNPFPTKEERRILAREKAFNWSESVAKAAEAIRDAISEDICQNPGPLLVRSLEALTDEEKEIIRNLKEEEC